MISQNAQQKMLYRQAMQGSIEIIFHFYILLLSNSMIGSNGLPLKFYSHKPREPFFKQVKNPLHFRYVIHHQGWPQRDWVTNVEEKNMAFISFYRKSYFSGCYWKQIWYVEHTESGAPLSMPSDSRAISKFDKKQGTRQFDWRQTLWLWEPCSTQGLMVSKMVMKT